MARRYALRLRRTVPTLVVGLSTVTVVALGALLFVTDQLEKRADAVVEAMVGAELASEMGEAVLRHRREVLAWSATGDPAYQDSAVEALEQARRLLSESSAYASTAEEAEALEEVRDALYGYRAAIAYSDLAPTHDTEAVVASYIQTMGPLEELLESTGRLERLYTAEAARIRDGARTMNRQADVVLWVAILLLGGGTVAFSYWVYRALYRPLSPLVHCLDRLQMGDLGARAPEEGPEEFAAIALGINGLATALQEQRQDQLSFMAAVAHDLRNPMGALRLMARRGAPDRPLPEEAEVRLFYAQVERQVDLMQRLVGDLLDSAQLQAGRVQLQRCACSLAEVVERVVELLRPTAPQHHLRVDVQARPVVDCDRDRIEQVLVNLLSNAIKYAPQGGDVDVRIGGTEREAVVEVVDRGIGIAPDEMARLFRPFQRAANVGGIEGTGLGLAAAARIVEAHGGNVSVRSRPGHGSTFRVVLPRVASG